MPRCQRRWPGFPVVVAEVLVNGEGAVTGNYRVLCSFGLSETAVTRSALWQVGPHDPTLECFPALANLLASWHADASKVVRIPNFLSAEDIEKVFLSKKPTGTLSQSPPRRRRRDRKSVV